MKALIGPRLWLLAEFWASCVWPGASLSTSNPRFGRTRGGLVATAVKTKQPVPVLFLLRIAHRSHSPTALPTTRCPLPTSPTPTTPAGYDYAGHGRKRESEDKKRLQFCLHFITSGSEAMARQLIDHLIKHNDFGYVQPDIGHTPDIAAKVMIAESISSAIALLKGPPTGFEQFA